MATTASAPLSAEPALPLQRREQHLPPKSYADAVEESIPANGHNGTDAEGVKNGANTSSGINGSRDNGSEAGHTASVLRIVDTGSAPQQKQEERPDLPRQESKHEYSATVRSCPLSVNSSRTNPP